MTKKIATLRRMKPPFHDMPSERFVRRIESASRNRDASLRIRVARSIELDSLRKELDFQKQKDCKELADSSKNRRKRWREKLAKSPLSVNLVEEEKNRGHRLELESQRHRCFTSEKTRLDSDIQEAAIEATMVDEPVGMGELRNRKRELLLQLRQLRAMRDVERTNSRIHEISCDRL